MKITGVVCYIVKAKTKYDIGGNSRVADRLPNSDYYRLNTYPQLYSDYSEALVVRVDTDEGLSGWGETQAPIAPEVPLTLIEKILGPALLGRSPLDTNTRYADMVETMRVRGHWGGYQIDAVAGLDTALWDIRGKAADLPISRLLGGRYRETLPCYVSGLRKKQREARAEEAIEYRERGFAGVKPFLGSGLRADGEEIYALRDALGPDMQIMVDALWRYDHGSAVRLGRVCEEAGVSFFEAPMAPEDIRGHARLAADLDVAIAVGEPLRTRAQFIDWLSADAMDVCQPDVMRNGVTESWKIAMLAEAMNRPVAYHTGCVTAIGMAATFHCAAAIPNFLVQEFQPVMYDIFNPWLKTPLSFLNGEILVPDGPGLGIEIDETRMMRDVVGKVEIAL